jgi:hypothetical protein
MYDFTILLLPGAFAASVALTLDILAAAAAMAPRVGVGPPLASGFICGGADASEQRAVH